MEFKSKERLKEVLGGFAGKKVLVIGDLMLDHYVETAARRLSREAPIPVSDVVAENSFAGGTANLACNITSLGGKATVVGVVGNDYEGELLRDILDKRGVDTSGIITGSRPTSLKTRYFLDGRQYFRIDREKRTDMDRNATNEMLKNIESGIGNADCVSVSDYDKNTVNPKLINGTVKLARQRKIKIVGQPKVNHYLDFIGFDCVKSNIREASKATGISLLNESSLRNMGIHLLGKLECGSLVLTRGGKGLTVFEGNNMIHLTALTPSKQFRRAIGIRDVMTAVLALSLTAGASILEASILGNVAAAISNPGPETVILSMKNFKDYLYDGRELEQPVTQVPLHR
jgi:D-beta-D-heptose 7-phosphate kinase/D-beta-D-heptose 1-phosphate adenosyltransferase